MTKTYLTTCIFQFMFRASYFLFMEIEKSLGLSAEIKKIGISKCYFSIGLNFYEVFIH